MSEKLISNDNIMIKSNLEKLNQTELINLILNQEKMLKQLLQEKQQKPIAKCSVCYLSLTLPTPHVYITQHDTGG